MPHLWEVGYFGCELVGWGWALQMLDGRQTDKMSLCHGEASCASKAIHPVSTQQPVQVLCSGRSEDKEGASQESVGQAGWPGGQATVLRAKSSACPGSRSPGSMCLPAADHVLLRKGLHYQVQFHDFNRPPFRTFKVQSLFITLRFQKHEFTYCLKFICNSKIHPHSAFPIIHACVQ